MEPPNSLKGRLVIASPNSPTQRLSSLLKKILTRLVPKLKSYIKDNWDLLKKLPRNLDANFTFFMCDIVSLYTKFHTNLVYGYYFITLKKYKNLVPIRFSK